MLPKPLAKITIKVIDFETGEPIENALAGAGFSTGGWEPKATRVEGRTDKDGIFVASGSGRRRISYGARHDDYYSSGFRYMFDQIKSFFQIRHKPWNPELIVKLRKIKNPIPMYGVSLTLAIPDLDKDIGFDLEEADWVVPYGEGKISDFIFNVTKQFSSMDDYYGKLTLAFSNNFDGIYTFPREQNYPSELKLPHLAPESGYKNRLIKITSNKPSENPINNMVDDQHYYFRVRSVEEDGKLIAAKYGKIIGEIKLLNIASIVKMDRERPPSIRFTYYLNSDGTMNTEYKRGSNLYNKPEINKKFEKVIGIK